MNHSEMMPYQVGGDFISAEDLVESVEAWRQRKELCEDVDYLESKGGMPWLYRGLQTDPKYGIRSDSIPARIAQFGSNEIPRDPPKSNNSS